MRFDTPIEVTEDTGMSTADAKRCGSKLMKQGSAIAHTLSTTDIIDCDDVLREAQEIRKKCANAEVSQVISGTKAPTYVIFQCTDFKI